MLSDGTLRVLAIAAVMLSANEGSLVVIEEIDKERHPNRAKHLLGSIRDIAEQRKLRVVQRLKPWLHKQNPPTRV